MNAALLKEEIKIYKLNTEKTRAGQNKPRWDELKYQTRAFVRFNSENQVIDEGEVWYPINRTFIVRAYVPVVETDQIEYDGKRYKILSINKNIYYNDIEINTILINN